MLRVRHGILINIEHNNLGDSQLCLIEILTAWLEHDYDFNKYGIPSWKSLAEAVWSVDKPLFEKIARDHAYAGENISMYALSS